MPERTSGLLHRSMLALERAYDSAVDEYGRESVEAQIIDELLQLHGKLIWRYADELMRRQELGTLPR
jgi:hypothetical protein